MSQGISHLVNIFSAQTQNTSHEPQHIGTLGFRCVEVSQEQVTHQDSGDGR